MAQNTFPAFTEMVPTVQDLQLIVDSLRQEDRSRTTHDGIFSPGIVNKPDTYLAAGSGKDSLMIKPFVAYTANGDRIEVSSLWDNLYPQGTVVPRYDSNRIDENVNIPVWYPYTITNANLNNAVVTQSINLIELGKGSVLHGIKLHATTNFIDDQNSNIFVSVGISGEPEKFLPPTLISQDNDISVMNLMYSLSDDIETPIIVTFTSDNANLNLLTSGSLNINFCIANLSGFDNSALTYKTSGYEISSSNIGVWLPSTTYHIVVRYKENASKNKQLKYTTIDGTEISTISKPTRYTTDYVFCALRKTGADIDATTVNDIKIGEVVTGVADESGNGHIIAINVNGKNVYGDYYTQYLTLPGYRFNEGIDASQIGDGTVTNTQFGYLNSLTANVQNQLNLKPNLGTDNTFTGENTFETQIKGSIDKVNGFTAEQNPAPNSLLVLDENGKIPSTAISESTFASIGNFYTVSSGVTTNGRSSFIGAQVGSGSHKITIQVKGSEENPLVINYPNGAVEKITSDQDLDGLTADGHYYLVKEQNGNFIFLPTAGGTVACIPTISSGSSFDYKNQEGSISKSYLTDDGTVYKAFDGTLTTGTLMGKVTYQNYNTSTPTISYLPSGTDAEHPAATNLDITFPTGVIPTAFSACFRRNQYDITPKIWYFEGSNDNGATWTQLATSTNSTWNIDEIKTTLIANASSYIKFRFTFNMGGAQLNNYMLGEETDPNGVTMPVNCYYFQIYATDLETKNEIVEGYEKPSNMTTGSYFLDISKKPYTGYKCVASNTFEETNYVKLGFVDVIGVSINKPVITYYPFCYNTFTYSDEKTTYHINSGTKELKETIAVNDILYFDHNLGVVPNIIKVKYQCVGLDSDSDDSDGIDDGNGYSIGDYVDTLYVSDTIGLTSVNDSISSSITTITLHPGASGSTLYVKHKLNGNLVPTSNGKWKAIIYCSRGW